MKSTQRSKKKKYEIYEHLEHYVRKTTYAHRLQWLQEANDFVHMIEHKRKQGTLFV